MKAIRNLMQILLLVFGFLQTVSAFALEMPIELITPTGVIKGSLTMPAQTGKVPVALIIAGSGPTDRDGNSNILPGKNNSLKQLANALADAGIASVRYDKRGVGESAASLNSELAIRFDDYVQDAAAWIKQLADDGRFTGVTVIGHSQGALTGILAAQKSKAQAYVSIAGVAESGGAVLRRQLHGKLPENLARTNEAILNALEAGKTVEVVPAQLNGLYRPSVQPFLISWFKYVPAVELAKLNLPCLILQGDTDIQVRVEDAQQLQRAAPACRLAIINGMNHVLKSVPEGLPNPIASYTDPKLPLTPALAQEIIQTIKK